jgi:hypothetical protein
VFELMEKLSSYGMTDSRDRNDHAENLCPPAVSANSFLDGFGSGFV